MNKKQIFLQNLGIDTGDITYQEAQRAQEKLNTWKAQGPDGNVAELFAWLEGDALTDLHSALNQNWRRKKLAKHENSANIASLFKKGDHENPENYRPISLLNISYKILAYIMHERISSKIDKLLGDNQSGFRRKRSTIDPIYCVRRLQDLAESGKDRMVMIFLDWEKAFDKIDHDKMFHALERLNIPKDIIDMIKGMYTDTYFRVQQFDQASEWKNKTQELDRDARLVPTCLS